VPLSPGKLRSRTGREEDCHYHHHDDKEEEEKMTLNESIRKYGKDAKSTQVTDEKLTEIAQRVGKDDVSGTLKAMQRWISMYLTKADSNPEFYFENIAKSYVANK
jgi:hypothetical protein